MEAHHNEVEPQTVEAVIVQAADALSGARPGARGESLESYVKRLRELEQIATRHEGVDKVYAMQAGREIRVMVAPDRDRRRRSSAALPRDRPRDREGARVPRPDQGHRHPRVARGRVREVAGAGYPWAAMKRYHVTTFGCQMNEHDSERMKGMLESLGYCEAPEREQADLILFNTCSIREAADSRFVAHLGHAKRVKRERPDVLIGVGGCWAQSVKDEVFARFPFVDVAFGPGQVHKLAEFLTSDSLTAQGYFEFEGFSRRPAGEARARVPGLGADLRRLQHGLLLLHRPVDARPRGLAAGRGARRGRRADGLRRRHRGHAARAERQRLRPRPRPQRAPAGDVRRACSRASTRSTGSSRIRYTSPHPQDMNEDVIRAHAELEALCEHIHLPLQSGSSRVLKAMRRTYSRERYLDRVALIREHVPDCAITTDIIVGFPGETEEDFAQTLDALRAGRLRRRVHVRLLAAPRHRGGDAARPGGARGQGRAHGAARRGRPARARERAQRFVGRTLEVLVEGPSRTDPTRLRGRSRHNKAVNFSGLAQAGEYVHVEVARATSQTLAGEESLLARAAAH